MRRIFIGVFLLLLIVGVAACATATPLPDLKPPVVSLNRVEVARYFPYPALPPTPTPPPNPLTMPNVPLALAYVFDVTNPNPYSVTLTSLKFTADFEAAPNEYFALDTPISADATSIPAGATNPVRVVVIFDTFSVSRSLGVTGGARLAALNLKSDDLIRKWWTAPGNASAAGIGYTLRASQGTAEFKSDKGSTVVTFEGKFPK
ncbi:MAG: hypothetical protein KGJ80_13440 [Chloroflexota bacterium]|nr:hypothetical protein [Chloroflexota bacterium]